MVRVTYNPVGGKTRMAASRNSGHSGNGFSSYSFSGQVTRYDLLLAAIPLVLAVALLTGLVSPMSVHVAVGGGALMGGAFVADALYFHPPIDSTESAGSQGRSSSFASPGDD